MPFTLHVPAYQSSAVSLIALRNRLGAQKRPTISPDTVGIISSCHRKPALVFPFTRPIQACLETYARHSSHSSSLSFARHFHLTLPENRSFSNFGTCIFEAFPIIYTSTFSPDHPPHADFDVMCDSSPEPHLAVPSLSSAYTKQPFSIASPVCPSNYLPGRSYLYAYRALHTDRPTYLIPIRAPELQS